MNMTQENMIHKKKLLLHVWNSTLIFWLSNLKVGDEVQTQKQVLYKNIVLYLEKSGKERIRKLIPSGCRRWRNALRQYVDQ